MIYFDYVQRSSPARLAIGKRIEARTQYQVLIYTARHSFSQVVLGKAATQHKVRPDAPHRNRHQARGIGADCSLASLCKKPDADGIDKDLRLAIEDLMCGAQRGDTNGSLTGIRFIHGTAAPNRARSISR